MIFHLFFHHHRLYFSFISLFNKMPANPSRLTKWQGKRHKGIFLVGSDLVKMDCFVSRFHQDSRKDRSLYYFCCDPKTNLDYLHSHCERSEAILNCHIGSDSLDVRPQCIQTFINILITPVDLFDIMNNTFTFCRKGCDQ